MYGIAPITTILAGLFTGLVFGFLLQRGGVTRYGTIVNQFLFRDFTVLKVMLTAIVTGAVGIWGMRAMGMDISISVKSAAMGPVVVGGLLFGVGMAVLGYCPGTGMAALGDGSRHAIPGLLGMIVGGGLFAELFPAIQSGFMKLGDITREIDGTVTDKLTAVDVTGLAPWWFIGGLVVVAIVVFVLIERIEAGRARAAT
jgi:uncharacterized membrane protein YedE/YeeE